MEIQENSNNYNKQPPLADQIRTSNAYIKWLMLCVCSFYIACSSLHTMKSIDEKISFRMGIFITAMGVIFFASLAELLLNWILKTHTGNLYQRRYNLLVSDILDITNKIVSAVQAILSCIAGIIVCNSSCRRSFLTASHYMSDAYAWFGAAYFIYDMWYMYRVYVCKQQDKREIQEFLTKNSNVQTEMDNNNRNKCENSRKLNGESNGERECCGSIQYSDEFIRKNETELLSRLKEVSLEPTDFVRYCIKHPVMYIHHIFLGSFGLLVIVYLRGKFGDCVYSFVYLMEISTPFVSIRGILSTIGLKKTNAYVINGVLMLITFFFCRILMWPYLYWWYSNEKNITFLQAILSLPLTCQIGTLILFLPQLYWFYLMIRGAVKIFLRKSTKKSIE